MNNDEYIYTQNAICEVGKLSSTLDLVTFVSMINQAQAMAPFMDPTLYRKAAANLDAMKQLAVAVQEVQKHFAIAQRTVIETAMRGDMPNFLTPPDGLH